MATSGQAAMLSAHTREHLQCPRVLSSGGGAWAGTPKEGVQDGGTVLDRTGKHGTAVVSHLMGSSEREPLGLLRHSRTEADSVSMSCGGPIRVSQSDSLTILAMPKT